jgi:hypothetical protein
MILKRLALRFSVFIVRANTRNASAVVGHRLAAVPRCRALALRSILAICDSVANHRLLGSSSC